jgi:hypothetical protein
MKQAISIFDEQYRVVSVSGDTLVIKGILSDRILTITNSDPTTPIKPEQFPPGKLIALTDPSAETRNHDQRFVVAPRTAHRPCFMDIFQRGTC